MHELLFVETVILYLLLIILLFNLIVLLLIIRDSLQECACLDIVRDLLGLTPILTGYSVYRKQRDTSPPETPRSGEPKATHNHVPLYSGPRLTM